MQGHAGLWLVRCPDICYCSSKLLCMGYLCTRTIHVSWEACNCYWRPQVHTTFRLTCLKLPPFCTKHVPIVGQSQPSLCNHCDCSHANCLKQNWILGLTMHLTLCMLSMLIASYNWAVQYPHTHRGGVVATSLDEGNTAEHKQATIQIMCRRVWGCKHLQYMLEQTNDSVKCFVTITKMMS